jgi:hypothetical protein
MRVPGILFCLFIALFFFSNCGGSASGGKTDSPGNAIIDKPTGSSWHQTSIRQISTSGLLLPQVKAVYDGSGGLHIAYFTDSLTLPGHYTLNHVLWDLGTQTEIAAEPVVDIDNCRALALAVDRSHDPVVAYQGGSVREGGSEQQSDVMFSLLKNDIWTEYTGGIGFVQRNPVFTDGLAGKHVSAAVDQAGNIHLCYQFFYEGIDAMNFNYPDLLYVKKGGSSPSASAAEETVEGNVYNPDGSASAQNRVGAYACLLMGRDGNPVIFYYADLKPNLSDPDTKGLRVSYRLSEGTWSHEWVETGFEVGGISAALDNNGNPGVAYYVAGEYSDASGMTHKECLRYASKASSSWKPVMVDESTFCGKYCSLAFDASNNPAIAYYSMQNNSGSLTIRDLMFARQSGEAWSRETVASTGDIGSYNTLLFDDAGSASICSYSSTDQTIYLFHQ